MYCSECGKKLAEGAKFCNFCGANNQTIHAPVKNVISDERKKDFEEELLRANKTELAKLDSELEKLKNHRSRAMISCGFVFVFGSIILFFVPVFMGLEFSEPITLMLSGAFVGAAFLGSMIGLLINYLRSTPAIKRKEEQIERFKRQNNL